MKFKVGDTIPVVEATTIQGDKISLPDSDARFIHLQFRRFAGCPICNWHLHQLGTHAEAIKDAGIREVVVFHSSVDEMMKYHMQLPFDCIADPTKALYRQFGVETSLMAALHPASLLAALRGMMMMKSVLHTMENGVLGLPADFLISPKGQVLAVHYGAHANDHWNIDTLMRLSAAHT